MMSERIVIVGASIAGLTTALALSRSGHDVVVLERDAASPPGSSRDVSTIWKRRGVPQWRHSHGFLARLRNVLRDRYPDLLKALLEAGVQERTFGESLPPVLAPSYTARPDDDDLTTLLCRRTTFERVLHEYVRTQSGVCIRTGVHITGVLSTDAGAVPQLTGLSARIGETLVEIPADVLIDATGRLSPFPAWLRALGAPVAEDMHETGIVYYTRFYRLRESCEEPQRTEHSSMGDLGYLKFGVFPGDNGTFSLTLAIPTIETELRILRQPDVFTQVCHTLPALAPWLDPHVAEPTTAVLVMGGLRNSYRQFVTHGQPAVLGYFAVGEAAVHTNPLYGRGCSLSVVHAHLLADVLHAVSDPVARAVQFHQKTSAELRPFYDAAVRRDQEGQQRARQGMAPPSAPSLARRFMQSLVWRGLLPAMRGDFAVRRAFVRDFHMLEPPGVAIRRPGILLRIARFWLRGEKRNGHLVAPRSGPSRAEMRQRLGLTISSFIV